MAAPRLRELARGARSVAVTIPDASRPCPSGVILDRVLDELVAAGVGGDAVTVVVGCGLHRTTSAAEREVLDRDAGLPARRERGRAGSADAARRPRRDVARRAGARRAPRGRGRPGDHRRVVEPHLYAGFSGGVKGIAIGCAGHETIAWTHRPAFIGTAGVTLGSLAGNPFHETLREIAARTSLAWAVNAVVNERGDIAAVAAGEPAVVQSSLARAHARAWLRTSDRQSDVIVAGVHAPKSANFYQASRAATYIGLATVPALADGGLLVLCADLPDGAGDGPGEHNFAAVLAGATSPAELVSRGLREPLGPGGQRAFVVARMLERFRIAVVGAVDPSFLKPLERLGVAACDSVDAALAREDARLRPPRARARRRGRAQHRRPRRLKAGTIARR